MKIVKIKPLKLEKTIKVIPIETLNSKTLHSISIQVVKTHNNQIFKYISK
jgi:hypothetical protein